MCLEDYFVTPHILPKHLHHFQKRQSQTFCFGGNNPLNFAEPLNFLMSSKMLKHLTHLMLPITFPGHSRNPFFSFRCKNKNKKQYVLYNNYFSLQTLHWKHGFQDFSPLVKKLGRIEQYVYTSNTKRSLISINLYNPIFILFISPAELVFFKESTQKLL